MKNNNMGLWKQCTLVLTTLAFAKSSLDVTCRRRESTPGVLVCVPGSHVILSCHGDVVVDGVLLTSQHAERSLTNPRSTRGVKPVTTQEMGIQADSERASKALELRVSRTTLEENPMTKEEEGSWWTMNGTPVEDPRSRDGTLALAEIGLANAGNYSCFRSGKRMSTIKITLGVPPQKPGLTCYRTSPNHKIRCEWSFPERLTPAPRCYLLLKKRRQSGQCSYSVTHNKCWCVLDTKRGLDDNSEYVAQLCVTSTAGNATSPDIHFTATGILKPDPPAQVKVRGVEGGSRMLTVSWSYPASWKQDNFFSLNFQLRYRPVSGEKHQIIDTLQLLSYEILDVIPHTEYELQLRAIEEYHNGMWSDWTSPVYARTWTGAEPTTFYNSLTHLEPLWPFHESSGLPPEEEGSGVDPLSYIAGDTLRFPSLWVCGGCVLIVLFLLLAAYTIRHREHFLSKIGKIGSHPPQHPAKDSSSQLPAQEHNSLAVALWPTSSPQQPRDSPLGENIASDGAHFHNMDYFLVQNE